MVHVNCKRHSVSKNARVLLYNEPYGHVYRSGPRLGDTSLAMIRLHLIDRNIM